MPFKKISQSAHKRGDARPKLVENVFAEIKKHPKRIIFPESEDQRILEGVKFLAKNKLLRPVLIGEAKSILAKCKKLKIPNSRVDIIDMGFVEDYSKQLYKLRKAKGLTLQQAQVILQQPITVAMMMLKTGEVDGVVYGATHPTAETLRPALQIIGLEHKNSWASSYFIMLHEGNVLFFADCAFNIEPDAKQLAQIAISTADSAKSFGFKPKVAMLSFSTHGSAKHPLSQKVANATKIVRRKRKDIAIDGEMQFDAAVVPHVAKSKIGKTPIKGDANVFIFPDLQSGNIAYKIAQRMAHDMPIGPIVQGLAKPVNDLSRGCTVEEVIEVGALTALQAIRSSKKPLKTSQIKRKKQVKKSSTKKRN